MTAALGSDAACLAAAGTKEGLDVRPPSKDESLCSLLPPHPMSLHRFTRRLRNRAGTGEFTVAAFYVTKASNFTARNYT